MSNRAMKKAVYRAGKEAERALATRERFLQDAAMGAIDEQTRRMGCKARVYEQNPNLVDRAPVLPNDHVFKANLEHKEVKGELDKISRGLFRRTDCGQPRKFEGVYRKKAKNDELGGTRGCPACC